MNARMFFSTVAAAERLSLSPRTLELYRRTGEGPAFYRFGCLVRYLDEDLEEWAAARRREGIARQRDERLGTVGWQRRKPPRRASLGDGAGTKVPARPAAAGRVPAREYGNGSRTSGGRGPVQDQPTGIESGRKLKSGS